MKKILIGVSLFILFPIVVLFGLGVLAVGSASEFMDDSYRWGGRGNE
ncbi:MAG: hypothetical protein PHC95_12775 [Parabacteroides sp.]|nr:hypothetical protein [Parabacteroides sp.]